MRFYLLAYTPEENTNKQNKKQLAWVNISCRNILQKKKHHEISRMEIRVMATDIMLIDQLSYNRASHKHQNILTPPPPSTFI